MRKTLHLAACTDCNNSCRFCIDGRVDGRGGPRQATDLPSLQRMLRDARDGGIRAVSFTSGEPTLGPHLVDAVRYARAVGYTDVSMNTNGRRLADEGLLERLLEAGLTELVLSIHGDVAEVHDALVGRPGAFVEVSRGLERLNVLRVRYPVRVVVLCVLCRTNLPRVGAMLRWFRTALQSGGPSEGGSPDTLSFTCMKMRGRAVRAWDELGVPYGELASAWLDAWDAAGRPEGVMLGEIPACVLVAAAGGGRSIPPLDLADAWLVAGRGATGRAVRDKTTAGFTKRAACATCVVGARCRGVTTAYVQKYGWGEFAPVPEGNPTLTINNFSPSPTPEARATEPVPDAIARVAAAQGLRPVEQRRDGAAVELSFAQGDGAAVVLRLEPRDDARPAFLRTAKLNIGYQPGANDQAAMAMGRALVAVLDDEGVDALG